MKNPCHLSLIALTAAMACACSPTVEPETTVVVAKAPAPPVVADVARAASLLPAVAVHKSPSCGCCSAWVEHVKQAGFPVEVIDDEEDLAPPKLALGVPPGTGSCHTAIVEGCFTTPFSEYGR